MKLYDLGASAVVTAIALGLVLETAGNDQSKPTDVCEVVKAANGNYYYYKDPTCAAAFSEKDNDDRVHVSKEEGVKDPV